MAGVKVDISSDIEGKLAVMMQQIVRPAPLFAEINEYLMRATRERFKTQTAPDGTAWAALSPRYKKIKHRNKEKILTFRGHLQGTLRGQYDDNSLEFGSDRKYAALMHYGGSVQRKARTTTVYFKRRSDGSVGNRFTKKKASDFSQTANIAAHGANYPARKFLGINADDETNILRRAVRYLQKPLD